MENSRGALIADAVVAELVNPSAPWNSAGVISVERSYLPVYPDGEPKKLKAAVVALTLENERLNRHSNERETYAIAIDLQQMVASTAGQVDVATVDPLDLIAQQIFDSYKDGHYLATPDFNSGTPTWKVMNRKREDLYDLDKLYAYRTWETLIVLTVQGMF